MSDEAAVRFPVGSFILDEMQERGWSIEELINRMDGSPETQLTVELLIHAPIKGATLDGQTAALLGKAFGTSKELWLNLDRMFQLPTPSPRSKGLIPTMKTLEKQTQDESKDLMTVLSDVLTTLGIDERGGGPEGVYYTHPDVEGEYLLRCVPELVSRVRSQV